MSRCPSKQPFDESASCDLQINELYRTRLPRDGRTYSKGQDQLHSIMRGKKIKKHMMQSQQMLAKYA